MFKLVKGFSNKDSEIRNGYYSKWSSEDGIVKGDVITYKYIVEKYEFDGEKRDSVEGNASIKIEDIQSSEYNTSFEHYNTGGRCIYIRIPRWKYSFQSLLFKVRRFYSKNVQLLPRE